MPINIDYESARKFTRLELFAKQAVEGFITGLHKSPFHGFSVEFAEHRIYNPGESTRHIDWKLFGRTDRFYTKKYEEETNLRCRIVLDVSSSMHFPKDKVENKLHFAIHTAASIMYLMRSQRDAVGLSVFDESIREHTPCKTSVSHHHYIFDRLERLLNEKSEGKRTFEVDALHEVAERIHKRSFVVVISDMLDNSDNKDELFASLEHLKHNKNEIVLIHVVDEELETKLDFENRPYTFVDLESKEEVKLNPSSIKNAYIQEKQKHLAFLKSESLKHKIDYVRADINKGYQPVIEKYLIKRLKMR